jgi:hypothetical protein
VSRVAVIVTRCDWRPGQEACGLEIEGEPDQLRMALNGAEYVFDLCDTHREAFYAAIGSVAHNDVQTREAPKRRNSPTERASEECPFCPEPKSYVRLAQHIARVHPEERAA